MTAVAELVPQWQHLLNLGGEIDRVYELAGEMEADPAKGLDLEFVEDVEGCFKRMVNGLWAVDPSDAPRLLIDRLADMPGEMDEWFRQFCDREAVELPQSKGGGSPTGWLITYQ